MKIKRIIRNIRFFIPILFRENPFIVISMILIGVFQAINSLLWVVFPKFIIDELMGLKRLEYLGLILVSYAVIYFLTHQITMVLSQINHKRAMFVDFKIDKMFMDKIVRVDYFNIEDPEFADQMKRAKQGMSQYSNGIYSVIYTLQNIIYAVITIAGVLGIIIFSGQYLLILVTLVTIIINAIITGKLQNSEKKFNDTWVRHSRKLWYYTGAITGFRLQKDLRLYQAKEMINDASNREIKVAYAEYNKQAKYKQFWNALDTLASFAFTKFLAIVILAYAVYNSEAGMSIALFTMYLTSIETFYSSTGELIYSLKSYQQDCAYQEEFINIMEKESVFQDGNLPIDKIESIEFKNVSFKYPRTDNYVLKDISFKINNKEKISLVGLNGSGKTTLIKLLCRFYKLEEGEILVNGNNIDLYKYDDYMKLIGIVFQDFKVISFSIKSNVANNEDNQEKLYDCLERAQVLDKVLSLPNKENTYINKWFDKNGIEFSGGEMQKFAIARCLYKDSDLVVLDEPTSNLDPMAEAEIYYHFNDIIGHKLSFFISHRLSSCIFSDKILVLDGCKIAEVGTHKELMKNKNGLYSQMFNTQAEYYKS